MVMSDLALMYSVGPMHDMVSSSSPSCFKLSVEKEGQTERLKARDVDLGLGSRSSNPPM